MSEKMPTLVPHWEFDHDDNDTWLFREPGMDIYHLALVWSGAAMCGAASYADGYQDCVAIPAPAAQAACDLICPKCLAKWREI